MELTTLVSESLKSPKSSTTSRPRHLDKTCLRFLMALALANELSNVTTNTLAVKP
jgi:hypothetical protein